VLIFAAPAHSSEFFEDVNREVRTVPDDLAKVPSIGQRHGIEFIAPSTSILPIAPSAVQQKAPPELG
jgi:hypothetical protein